MDIFGKNVQDYAHLRDVAKTGGDPQAHLEARRAISASGAPVHDFNAYGMVQAAESNAQTVGYATNNLEAIMTMVDEVLYVENRLPEFVPITMDVPEGANSYAYRIEDRTGEGRFISRSGRDAPSATAFQRLDAEILQYGGIDAEWTLEDFRQAMQGGFPLQERTIRAAVQGGLNHIERIALTGATAAADGFVKAGLVNQPVTGAGAVTKNDGQGTNPFRGTPDANEMLAEMQEEVAKLVSESNEVVGRNLTDNCVVFLPTVVFGAGTTTRLPDTNMSVIEYFARNNQFTSMTGNPVMVKSVKELETPLGANVRGVRGRMVTTVMSDLVYEMAVAFYPRVIDIETKGRVICAPVEYKFAPLKVKRPKLIRYLDGV